MQLITAIRSWFTSGAEKQQGLLVMRNELLKQCNLLNAHLFCLIVTTDYCTAHSRRREIFFHTSFGGNSDGPEATRDCSEATLMVRQQKIIFRNIDGPEATRDRSEATLIVRMQPVIVRRQL